jgi:murein L,D-transpeptidase YafK
MPAYATYVLKTQRPRLAAAFAARGFKYPPRRVTFVVIKDVRQLEIWAQEGWADPILIKKYPATALSGHSGPKLRQGDKQVPEGVYSVLRLNPNSKYNLSIKLDYPNEFDRDAAALDGRKNPGGDIFIHGGNVSAGCIAVGDDAVEEFFTLAHDTGTENVRVVIAPRDFRLSAPRESDFPPHPKWLKILYNWLDDELLKFVEKKI